MSHRQPLRPSPGADLTAPQRARPRISLRAWWVPGATYVLGGFALGLVTLTLLGGAVEALTDLDLPGVSHPVFDAVALVAGLAIIGVARRSARLWDRLGRPDDFHA